jgi:FkbM family methyltransferase
MSSRIGNFAKHKLIGAGLYRPARKLVDFIDRSRAHGKKKRKASYSSFVGKGDLVFDAGANIGDYAETFLSLGARVVAIEPQASCVKELRARFKDKNIAIEFMAVGEHDGVGELFLRKHTWAAGLIQQWDEENTGSGKVPITTFDALIRKHGIPDKDGH